MTFSFASVSFGVFISTLICTCLKRKIGPLVVLSVWLLHTRAALLCARREIGRVPERCRQQYATALNEARKQG